MHDGLDPDCLYSDTRQKPKEEKRKIALLNLRVPCNPVNGVYINSISIDQPFKGVIWLGLCHYVGWVVVAVDPPNLCNNFPLVTFTEAYNVHH